MLDPKICDRARLARDPRFDGLFFTGVLSTGVFCRPICPAPAPKPANVVYFPTAAAAAQAGLRPCLRCRPESAPGTPAWNGTSATVARALTLIRQGALNEGNVERLALRLGVGSRHLLRLFKQHIGAGPKALANTQKVLFAKKLLGETDWPVSRIAFSCGFGSIRRFNAAFRKTYGQSPTAFRRGLGQPAASVALFQCSLRLPYRPLYHWERMLSFFRARAVPGVEMVDHAAYHRSIRLNDTFGLIHVSRAKSGHALVLRVESTESRDLMALVERVRRMFDLDANMDAILPVLAADEMMLPIIQKLEGLRPAGSWDPFETAVRAVVGQQISVQAARTVAGRIARFAGPSIGIDNNMGLTHFFPTAAELYAADLKDLGVPENRQKTLKGLARGVAGGDIVLEANNGLSDFVQRLTRIPGIGPWTAHYIAMRGLGEPDAFPAGDLGIIRALTRDDRKPTPRQVLEQAERWRPWRAYAATYLWNM
jgi:AraC family transcriptional regulator of adaptative response / DNA-3-methyladenine glycosylase II